MVLLIIYDTRHKTLSVEIKQRGKKEYDQFVRSPTKRSLRIIIILDIYHVFKKKLTVKYVTL